MTDTDFTVSIANTDRTITIERKFFENTEDQEWLDEFAKRHSNGQPKPSGTEPLPKRSADNSPEAPFTMGERVFTDAKDRKITAKVARLDGDRVTFDIKGKYVEFPVNQLSADDQLYLKSWAKNPIARRQVDPVAGKLLVQVWEEDGYNSAARSQNRITGAPDSSGRRTLPIGSQFEKTKGTSQHKHYRVDITNSSNAAARPVTVEYVLFVREADGKLRKQYGSTQAPKIPAGGKQTVRTDSININYSKTTSITPNFYVDGNGNIVRSGTSRNVSRDKESFGGVWVRVRSGGKVIKEIKKLTANVAKAKPQF